jgi:hypothetical protein
MHHGKSRPPTESMGPGRVKTKTDLVIMPSGERIFAFIFSARDHRPQNSGCSHTARVSVRDTKHVRDDGSFPAKRSPDVGDGCAANHFQPRLLLMAELDQFADAGIGEPGICNGPKPD